MLFIFFIFHFFFDAIFLLLIYHLLLFVIFTLLYFKITITNIRLVLPLLLYTKILIATEVKYINYCHDIHDDA